jgi:hypothetical protein
MVLESPVAADAVVEAVPPRYGPGSRACPTCGYLLPQPPHEEVCRSCGERPQVGPQLSTIEWLFLAVQRLSERRQTLGLSLDEFLQRELLDYYIGRGPDGRRYHFTRATPITELRAQLAKDAAAWREARCPIAL